MHDLLEPMAKEFTSQNGDRKTYHLSKFDAVTGREIIAKYPLSNAPKLGEYATSEATMFKLMGFVAVETENGALLRLSTPALVRNHVPDWEVLMRIEWAMLEYNCSFFGKGLNSGFLESLKAKAPALISQMLTALSAQSSQADKPPSTN